MKTNGTRARSGRFGRWAGAYGVGATVAVAANGYRLRKRLHGFDVLPPGPIAVTDHENAQQFTWVIANGAVIDSSTRAAAQRYMTDHQLDALDLIPADLDTVRALDLLRMVDPATFKHTPLAVGRGAFQALCLTSELSERAGIAGGSECSISDMVHATIEAKRHAPRSMSHVISAGVRAAPESADDRAETIRAIYGSASSFAPSLAVGQIAMLALSAVGSTPIGAAAAAAYCAQPGLVLGGSPLEPGDLGRRSLTRLVADAISAVRVASSLRSTATPKATESDRAFYSDAVSGAPGQLSPGNVHGKVSLGRFFEPDRSTCPWCDSPELAVELRTTDLLQHKPGEFKIDRCEACGHRFQNPRLSIEGLEYYYRDFYDGLGAESSDFVFGATDRSYVGRAELVKRHSPEPPKRWLDVGTGHGHFPLVAADVVAGCTFDGLDMTDGIDEAQRRGWVTVGHRGLFPELADGLVGQYDVISMHHYLEHTREPNDELEAAAKILRSGGMLMIEVPNPASIMGRVLGRWWVPWFQPQHQHLIPHENLVDALDGLGFDLVELEIAASHQPVDLTMAAWFAINHIGIEVGLPWRPPPTPIDSVRRVAAFAVGSPVLAAALIIDNLGAPLLTRFDGGNTYRLLAKKR